MDEIATLLIHVFAGGYIFSCICGSQANEIHRAAPPNLIRETEKLIGQDLDLPGVMPCASSQKEIPAAWMALSNVEVSVNNCYLANLTYRNTVDMVREGHIPTEVVWGSLQVTEHRATRACNIFLDLVAEVLPSYLGDEEELVINLHRYGGKWMCQSKNMSSNDVWQAGNVEVGLRKYMNVGNLLSLRPGEKVLDVGSGCGIKLSYLSQSFGVNTFALDLSLPNAEYIHRNQHADFVCPGDILSNLRSFPKQSFDVVFANAVFETARTHLACDLVAEMLSVVIRYVYIGWVTKPRLDDLIKECPWSASGVQWTMLNEMEHLGASEYEVGVMFSLIISKSHPFRGPVPTPSFPSDLSAPEIFYAGEWQHCRQHWNCLVLGAALRWWEQSVSAAYNVFQTTWDYVLLQDHVRHCNPDGERLAGLNDASYNMFNIYLRNEWSMFEEFQALLIALAIYLHSSGIDEERNFNIQSGVSKLIMRLRVNAGAEPFQNFVCTPEHVGQHRQSEPEISKGSPTQFAGVWKMTYASAHPREALNFAIKYLGALDALPTEARSDSCAYLQWVTFPASKIAGRNSWGYMGNNFELHFVQQFIKPTGNMTIKMFEELVSSSHRNFSRYSKMMDTRIVMETDNLDPLVARLLRDHVPFLPLTTGNGTFSVFLEIPYGIIVEVIAPRLTVVVPRGWDRCSNKFVERLPPALEGETLHGNHVNESTADVVNLKIRRFVYASSNPKSSHEFVTRYIHDGRSTQMRVWDDTDACFESHSVDWSNGVQEFGMEFIDWYQNDDDSYPKWFETYTTHLTDSFKTLPGNDWFHHYMDYHAGIVVSDCDQLLIRLEEDNVPYLLRPNRGVVAVFVQDPVGITHEFACAAWSLVHHNSLKKSWRWCSGPGPVSEHESDIGLEPNVS